jgi:hypothetical protein
MLIPRLLCSLIMLSLLSCNGNAGRDDNEPTADTTRHAPASLRFSFDSMAAKPALPLPFSFKFVTDDGRPADPTNGEPIDCLLASEDLRWFGHTVASKDTKGIYQGSIILPFPANYSITPEFREQGYTIKRHESFPLHTTTANAGKKVYNEPELTSDVDGYSVKLLSKKLAANVQSTVVMKITKAGQPVLPETIQSLSGEQTHMYCFNTATKEFIHATSKSDPMSYWYLLSFPKPGLYRTWIEFMTNNKVHLAAFVIRVD